MTSSTTELQLDSVTATAVDVTDEQVRVELDDGRTVTVPTAWFPRLKHATEQERRNVEIGPPGTGLDWPDVDADISYRGLLLGRKSDENPDSFQWWLENRKQGKRVTIEQWFERRKQQKQQTT